MLTDPPFILPPRVDTEHEVTVLTAAWMIPPLVLLFKLTYTARSTISTIDRTPFLDRLTDTPR